LDGDTKLLKKEWSSLKKDYTSFKKVLDR